MQNIANYAIIMAIWGKYFMQKFLIIDGNSLAFRAFYALPFLTNSEGAPTGAVFGFMNMFLKVVEECQPTHIAIAFDFGKKTFRNQIFAEYKGTRKETPEELRAQFPVLKNLLRKMNITVIEKEGFEADDIIGTLSKTLPGQKIVLSGDRDLLQLIDDNVEVWLTHKGISEIHKMDESALMRDFGISPKQVIELKALMGDTSDNIPGIQGIGPKTATNLIQQFDNIDNLYENLDNPNITPKLKEKLSNGKESAVMSKSLATIKLDCDVCLQENELEYQIPFSEEVTSLIKELDMSSLLKRKTFFVDNEPEVVPQKALTLKTISTLEELKQVCEVTPKEFAFNLGKDISFSFNQDFWFKVESEFTLFSQPPEIEDCLKVLARFLEDKEIFKIVADYKTQKRVLADFGFNIDGEVFDINLANYLLGNKEIDGGAVDRFFSLKTLLKKDLEKQHLDKIYFEMELPLEDVLYDMELAGFCVDKEALSALGKDVEKKLLAISANIINMAGEEFNLNSPKQLASILFDKLALPLGDNKDRSTSVEVLQKLAENHPIITEILKYRKLQKLKSTYIDAFLQKLSQTGGNVIHTVFNQTLASTGRLSSSAPNLQNLPVRDDEGKEIRKAFISRYEGGVLVSADYNQIELRLLAHLSGDEKLISAFNAGEDIHTLTAMQMFGLKKEEVTATLRRNAKAINFGIVYGISGVGLADNTGLSRREAVDYINKYFEVYPTVKAYLDNSVLEATRKGYAKTIFGRRRKIPELKSDNHQTRQFGTRVAKNMPLQGSASDIIKLAMLKVSQALKDKNLESKLILQIHDELIVDCPKHEEEIVKTILKASMENVVNLSVKLPVSVESGANYYEI